MKTSVNYRFWLLAAALLIVGASLYFTGRLTSRLAAEERQKMELWAEAVRIFNNMNDSATDIAFYWRIIEENKTIPVVIVDEADNLISAANFPEEKVGDAAYFEQQIARLKGANPPIEVIYSPTETQYIYYDDSQLLKMIARYPVFLLLIIGLFLGVSFWAFASDKRSEQNRVWVGLSKETAHQLGTPISSLLAWETILKERHHDDAIVAEMGKDVARLSMIAERFSKVGSQPVLQSENVAAVLENAVDYMRHRTSQKIAYTVTVADPTLTAKLNISLFEWVIENLCKNAVDAIDGAGRIDITATGEGAYVFIECSDTGKGIDRSKFRTVFKPGYTTKKRGWGLGLSLAKRIIESYHRGRIVVKASEQGVGTTFRITLPR